MAVNIGPKIGIDGEKEYRDSINNIIQQQKTLKAEMQATSSGWDKNTSAMKKAKDSAENLSKQVENQQKRVDELNKMLEESSKKYGENDQRTLKWKEAVAGATAELNKMKGELDDLPNMVQAFGSDMSAAGEKISGIGDGITKFGGSVSAHITAPLAAVGAASIAAFKEVDEGLDTIISKTGATGEAAEGMQAVYESLATTIPTDFATVGEAVGEVSTKFDLQGAQLEELSGKFIKYAQINGTDVAGSVDKVQAAMMAFGLEADKAGDVLDIFTTVGQQTGISQDALASTLASNSALFTQMGWDINTASGFLGQLEVNGVDSGAAMAGLKKALQEATKEGKTMPEALAELQTKLQGANSDTEAMAYAMELFGNKAGPSLALAIQEGRLSLDEASLSVQNYGDSVSTTFDATIDPIDQTTLTMNQLKLAGSDVGNTLAEIAVPALQTVADVVKDLKAKWDELSPSQQQNIVKFALVAAAVGPVIAGIGTVITTIGSVISIGGTLVSGIGTVVAVLGGPLTIAIGAAIAAGVLIAKNWDTIKEGAATLFSTIKEKFDSIKKSITDAFDGAKKTVTDTWDSIKKTVSDGIEKIKGLVNFKWELPKLKMPHFSITGSFSLNPPSVPHLDIEWYAKAMQNGVILRSPTIFGAANGNLLGGGEAGPEVVVGASSLFDMIRGAVATTNNYGNNNVYVYGAPGQDVHELAREIATIINADIQAEGAVW